MNVRRVVVGTLAAVLTAIGVVAVVVLVMLVQLIHNANAADRRNHAQAEADVVRYADNYAAEVIATGQPAPTDAALVSLAERGHVIAMSVVRTPGLTVTILSSSHFESLFGSSGWGECFDVTFTGLGGPTAGYTKRELPRCPTTPPLRPNPTTS